MNTDEFKEISEKIIGAAFEVSNHLGTGFLERVYENALMHELSLRGLHAVAQQKIEVRYKGVIVGNYVADLVVEKRVILELKCCDGFAPEHLAQCLNYLKATGFRLGLMLNFQRTKVEVKRVSL
jgi:GxxExxY protein